MMAMHPNIAEALRLTRAGRLAEATALLARGPAAGVAAPPEAAAMAGEVIDLTAERETITRRPRPSEPGAAAGGRFEARAHGGVAGRLDYRLYLPPGARAGMPLVVMLHGCTQSPEDFARGTGMNRLADEQGFLVAYPRQDQAANAQKCWNWFRPEDQRRDAGEPALIAGLTRDVLVAEGADRARVFVAGLSAGGAAAAIMAAAYPDLYAAVGVHSGLACGSARDLPSAFAAMRGGGGGRRSDDGASFVPLITFHGDGDPTVNEINSREIVAAASRAVSGHLATRVESGGGGRRRFTRAITSDAHGRVLIEQWTVHGLAHAWSGGDAGGTYTDPAGPDASREMIRFFLDHGRAARA